MFDVDQVGAGGCLENLRNKCLINKGCGLALSRGFGNDGRALSPSRRYCVSLEECECQVVQRL